MALVSHRLGRLTFRLEGDFKPVGMETVSRINPSAKSMAGALRHSKSHRIKTSGRRIRIEVRSGDPFQRLALMLRTGRSEEVNYLTWRPPFVIPERPVSREVTYS